MQKYFKKGIFDRYDGWRIRNVDPAFSVIPYFLRTRIDSQCFFEEVIPITNIENFIHDHQEDLPDLTMMHVIMAGIVRILSQRPYLNRFVIWNKLYARNTISISIAIKRSLSDKGEETLIKPEFEPTDTLYDVMKKTKHELDINQKQGQQNGSDTTSKLFGHFPSFLLRFVVSLLRKLDNIGLMPKFINKVSPWHCSLFLTNLGSLGIGPIYHHLYEFGTCSLFVAMGGKNRKQIIHENDEKIITKTIGLKFVTDERICDGHYYAVSMRLLKKLLLNPSALLQPPANVIVDDGVNKKRIDI